MSDTAFTTISTNARNTEILLLEEDPLVRVSTANQLAQAGYGVYETGNYQEARELLLQDCPFRLFLVEMTPLSLAMVQQLRSKKIMVPILITITFPTYEAIQFFRMMTGVTLLVRPYHPDELLQTVDDLLHPHRKEPAKLTGTRG